MIETKDALEKAKREFFISKFVPKLEDWKRKNKDKGGTDKAFALLIGVDKNMIPQYKKGDAYPRPETLKKIIQVLGVPEDYFTPTTKDELFQFSPDYMNDIGENKILPYCEEVGLDPQFLVVMSHLFGESLGDQFPFWTPMMVNVPNWFKDRKSVYKRPDPLDFWNSSAEMTSDVKVFQIEVKEKDGSGNKKRLTLTYPDLLFLRDVQDEVRDYVEFLFIKRKKALQSECEEASRRAQSPTEDGGVSLRSLKGEELNEIDRYYSDYVDNKVSFELKRRRKDGDDQSTR